MVYQKLNKFIYLYAHKYIGGCMYTSARLEVETKNKLESLKNYSNESLNSVIKRLINNSEKDNVLSENELVQIQKALENIKKGKLKTLNGAFDKWGV